MGWQQILQHKSLHHQSSACLFLSRVWVPFKDCENFVLSSVWSMKLQLGLFLPGNVILQQRRMSGRDIRIKTKWLNWLDTCYISILISLLPKQIPSPLSVIKLFIWVKCWSDKVIALKKKGCLKSSISYSLVCSSIIINRFPGIPSEIPIKDQGGRVVEYHNTTPLPESWIPQVQFRCPFLLG